MKTEANPPSTGPSQISEGATESTGPSVRPSQISEGVTKSTGSFELVFSVGILALVGFGLDSLLGWLPILTVTFAIAGAIGAIASIYFRYREAMRQQSGRSWR